jgi:5-methylcytosine-specific restriction endonuclease McrA
LNSPTKRIDTRGKKLEFDRKISDASYDDLNNIVLACYWCNNAKTDTFTHEEFKEVGKVFANIWKNRFNQ